MEWLLGLTAKGIYSVAQVSSNLYCFFIVYEPKIPEALISKDD